MGDVMIPTYFACTANAAKLSVYLNRASCWLFCCFCFVVSSPELLWSLVVRRRPSIHTTSPLKPNVLQTMWNLLLTHKAPRKTASENVVCLSSAEYSCKLHKAIFCILANSVDPDQTAPKGAVWSGFTLFAEMTFKITSRKQSRWQLLWLAL